MALCKRLREDARRDTPVIMLTARDQLDDRLASSPVPTITWLKPLPCQNWPRASRASCAVPGWRSPLQVGDLSYDLDTLEVTREGRLLKLNPVGLNCWRC
jgi:DNA-binding response OmpR family regulator